MVTNRFDKKSLLDGKGWLRRLVWIVTTLVFVVVVILILAIVWLVPAAMQREVKRRLSKLSEGSVHIENIQANYSGRIVVKEAQFSDTAKRPWLMAKKMTITLTDWPSLHPAVDVVQIDGLDLRLSTEDGKLLLPVVHWPKPSDDRDQKSVSSRLLINQGVFTIVDPQGVELMIYEDVTLSVSKRMNGDYEFELNRIPREGSEVFVADGNVNIQNAEYDVSLEIKHLLTKTEMTVACMALNIPKISAEGRLAAKLTVTGDLNKSLGFQTGGRVELSDCVLFYQERVLVNDLVVAARLDGQQLDVNEFTAIMCDGSVKGKFHAEIKDNQFVEYRGQVQATSVNYPKFTSVLITDSREAARGSFDIYYDFSRRHDSKALRGKGFIFLNDIDVRVLPVIPTIFQFVGLSQFEPLKMSDAEAEFHNVGPLVIIENGHISNRFAAIEFEPGGKVDLQAKQVNGYVVAAPLSKITRGIERLPIINIFANLKDKLMRLHVKGHWSDPPNRLIKKEPIEDLAESTVDFIEDVAETGGQFGQEMIDMLGGLLKSNNKRRNK